MSANQDELPPNSHEYSAKGFREYMITINAVAFIAVGLRFYSRGLGDRRRARFWWDDWVALASVPLMAAMVGVTMAMLDYGLGHHIWMVPPEDLAIFLKLVYSVYFIYDLCLFVTKLCALLFFNRVFPALANSKWFNWALWTAHLLNVGWFISIGISTFFLCIPFEKNWNPSVEGNCDVTMGLHVGSALSSVFVDVIILLLPLPKIWSLTLSVGKRMGLTVVFVLGYMVIVVSLGRLVTMMKKNKDMSEDVTYYLIKVAWWLAAEPPVTMISLCLPTTMHLGRRISNNYLIPFASKMSSLTGQSKSTGTDRSMFNRSGAASSGIAGDKDGALALQPYSEISNKGSGKFPATDAESVGSDASMRGILPRQARYGTQADVEVGKREISPTVPVGAIRVDTDFTLDKRMRQQSR